MSPPLATHTTAPLTPTPRPSATFTSPALPSTVPPSPTLPGNVEFYPLPGLPSGFIDLRVAANDSLWLLTSQSIITFQPATGAQTFLSDFSGVVLGMDNNQRAWTLANNGDTLAVWDGTIFSMVFTVQAGWESLAGFQPNARGFVADVAGNVWLALTRDVRRFDGEQWTTYVPDDLGIALSEREDARPSWTLTAASDGRLWVGECDWGGPGPLGGSGARWFDGQHWHGSDSPVASGCVTVIYEDPLGQIWLGLDDQLWRYDPATGHWDNVGLPAAPEGARFGYVVEMAVDSAGDSWLLLSLCGGASCDNGRVYFHLHEGVWTQVGQIGEYPPGGLVFDTAGAPWLFTTSTIARVENDAPVTLMTGDIRDVAADGAGRIWFIANLNGQFGLWELIP